MENLVGNRKIQIPRETALAIREAYKAGATWKQLAEKFGLSGNRTLQKILKGTHVSLVAVPHSPVSQKDV